MANENDYIPEGSGPNGELQEGDDLKKESKDTLGSYLSKVTSESNKYAIAANPRIETTLTDSNKPAEFQTGGQDSTEGFTKTFSTNPKVEGGAVGNFETLSDSGKFNLGDFLDKNAQVDGHDLLRSIKPNKEPGEPGIGDSSGATALPTPVGAPKVQQLISGILKDGNRFDPTPGSSPYIEDGRFTEPGIPIAQGAFGVYNTTAARTTIDELKKVAHALMVKQTGHQKGKDTDPDGGSTILTTDVQRGADTLSVGHTRPINAFGAPERPSLDIDLKYNDVDGKALRSQRSYGALSSYREEFETSPISNAATAIAAFGEYLIGALIFTAVLELLEKLEKAKAPADPAAPSTLKKGHHKPVGSTLKLLHHLGIPALKNPPWLCAIYGIAAFFKLPASHLPTPDGKGIPAIPAPLPGSGDGGSGMEKVVLWFTTLVSSGALTDIFSNMLFGAGYYANMTRVVRRDLDVMVENLGAGAASGLGGGLVAIFELLTSLNRYNSWTFYVTLLKMGETWLNSYAPQARFDEIPLNGQTKVMLSRGNASRNDLAWRHRSAPALMLLNDKYVNAQLAFGMHPDYATSLHNRIGDAYSRNPKSPYYDKAGEGRKGQSRGLWGNKPTSATRLSRDQVVEIENELDSEYMPFYFHDLRTNEVIGFQAFLSDIKDSYSVSYAESGGYGRIDKVKIYQDTTRSINVSWTMIATSPQDFDSMWYSINKMVQMIYPQFSMGKSLRAGDKKFVMPFSQIPTATPVVRLRIGDIIRSNYSRFNLARLFGLSEIKPAPKGGGKAGDISSAPFDLSALSARESASKKKEDEDRKKYEEMDRTMASRFGGLPDSATDDKHGFVPGDVNWGKAILLASSAGYMTYDTNEGKEVPLGATDISTAKNVYSSNKPAEGATKVEATPFPSRPSAEGEVKILERIQLNPEDPESTGLPEPTGGVPGSYPLYLVQYKDRDDAADPYGPVSKKKHFHTYVVTTDALRPIKPEVDVSGEAPDPTVTLGKQITDIHDFFDPDNNAIVRSFEAAGGRGLAGVITSFDMDWNDSQWDMGGIGRRAPTMVKCSIAFSPIHDIVPGLDNNGMMRAMNYPVGGIAGPLGTDFFDPGGVPGDVPGLPAASKIKDASLDNLNNFKKSKKQGGEPGKG
tara:strand:+ start:5217 stop:8630 length:3414 start_codon:yes stop_codon:yes gene_type:complete